MGPTPMAADRTTEVADATQRRLIRFGVRRTTMDDIAGATGMSRSAVYRYVRDMEDAVRQLSARVPVVSRVRNPRA
ncbi:helix-turn-helix domain-containing protein [Nocardia sp. R16R-3T]